MTTYWACASTSPQPGSLSSYCSRSGTWVIPLSPLPPAPECALVHVKAKLPLISSFPLPSIFAWVWFYSYFFPLVTYIVYSKSPVCSKTVSRTLMSIYLIFMELFTEDISPAQTPTVLTTQRGLASGGCLLLCHSISAKAVFVLK